MHSIGPTQLHASPTHAAGKYAPRLGGAMCAALLMLAPAAALAQDAAGQAQTGQDARAGGQLIQNQMTAAEFRAAGLDQLSAGQLANLNAWLNHTLEVETRKAAKTAAAQTREADKGFFDGGFFDGGSEEAISSHIVGTFEGFAEGRKYTLDNGQVWIQTDSADLDGVTLEHPGVTIKPGVFGVWYLVVGDYNTRAKVKRIK